MARAVSIHPVNVCLIRHVVKKRDLTVTRVAELMGVNRSQSGEYA